MAKKGNNKNGKQLTPPNDKATRAIAGQLGTISDQVQKQLTRNERSLDKQSAKTLAGMRRLRTNQREFGQALLGAAQEEAKSFGVHSGMVNDRIAAIRSGNRLSNTAAKAQTKTTKGTGKAATKQAHEAVKTGVGVAKNSMSLLAVLAAQKESEFQHELMMQQLSFDQSVHLAQYQNQLQREYTQWQYDNGYLLTPEDEQALQWKYDRRNQLLSYRLNERQAEKENNQAIHQQFVTQQDALTDAIVTSTRIFNEQEGTGSRLLANKMVQEDQATSVRDALVQIAMSKISPTVPADTEMSGIHEFVAATFDSLASGGRAPTWTEAKAFIAGSDSTGSLAEYINTHNAKLEKYHDDYRAIRVGMESSHIATSNTPTEEAAGEPSGGSGLAPVVAAGATIAAAAAGRAMRPVMGPGNAGRMLVAGEAETVARGIDAARQATQKFFTRGGWFNPFGNGAMATNAGIVGLEFLRHADPKTASAFTGQAFTDERGVSFRYSTAQGGYIIDTDSAQANWDKLTPEEKEIVQSHNENFGTS